MRRALQLTSLVVTCAIAAAAAAAHAEPTVKFPPVSENAALQYWQAFALLPTLDAEQEKLLDDRATVPLDDAVKKLLGDSQVSLLFLKRGAQLSECDWGLDYRDGANMYLPYLAKARTLARLAALDARFAFETDQSDRGRDDAFGMVMLARHVGRDYTLVSVLVCHAIEGMVIDLVAPFLPEARASYADVMSTYSSLPPSPPLAQAVLCEKRMAYAMMAQLQEAERRRPGSWREMWKEMLGPDTADPFLGVENFRQFVEVMEKFQGIYDELHELAKLPPAEFDAKYPDFVKRAQAASSVATILLPAMEKTIAVQRRGETRMAMLLAAIAVVESGPEKLKEIKDPYGDGPFTYRKLDSGFELASKLLDEGQPVTLVIGQKAAAALAVP